jgi:hypothetical protein
MCVGLARFLPFEQETRFAIGFVLVIPLWTAAACTLFVVHNGVRAVLLCGGATLVLSAIAFGFPT